MPRFPYVNFPFPFYKGSPRTSPNFYNFQPSPANTSYVDKSRNNSLSTYNNLSSYTDKKNLNFNTQAEFEQKNKSNKNNDDFLFDLFGLKIYSDDVLLVSLIYFLYSEGVKDDSLFIVLILLLLS